MPTPNPQEAIPLRGMRVQLVTALGDLVADAVTDAAGTVTLTAVTSPGDSLLVFLPAIGLTAAVDAQQPTLTITLPAEVNASGATP